MTLQVSILPQKRRQAEAVDREHLRGALPSTSSTMGLALSPGMHTASGPSGYRAHSRSTDWCGLQFLTLANQVRRPIVHEPTPALEQVRAPIGCLDPVLDHMREGRFDDLARMIRLLCTDSDTFHGHPMRFYNNNNRSELWSTLRVAGSQPVR